MEDDGSLAGQIVMCPHCRGQVRMPSQPAVAPAFPTTLLSNYRPQRQSQPSSGFWAFFDLSFKHYLTPVLIRTLWVLVLSAAALLLLLNAGTAIASALPDNPQQTNVYPHSGFGQGMPDSPTSLGRTMALLTSRGFAFLLHCVLTVMTLIAVRISFESVIVLFNIAESLTSIDKKTTRN
ncbi:MAG TPA: DUF4282 domain-containing protein [Pirellulales bacterium]|jgi:hypothetical protein|nr:DUF4282 domain-containing protein [Pirellulales bacterium]